MPVSTRPATTSRSPAPSTPERSAATRSWPPATAAMGMRSFDYNLIVDPATGALTRTTVSVPASWSGPPAPNTCWQTRKGGQVLVAMRPRGFTLVELLIGMAILAILMLLALPTFSEFMTQHADPQHGRLARERHSTGAGRGDQAQPDRRVRSSILRRAGSSAIPRRRRSAASCIRKSSAMPMRASSSTPGRRATSMLTFSGIGQFLDPNPSDLSNPLQVDSTSRRLRVARDPTSSRSSPIRRTPGGIRVCDRDFTNLADAKTGSIACPPLP